MSGLRDRYLYGGAAAACAVCCAAPVIGLLGVVGFAATAVTLAMAGVAFALVVGGATLLTLALRRHRARPGSATEPQPVDLGMPDSRP